MERRLATILAADVVGYSRLMAMDEEGTLARLRSCKDIVEAQILNHGGRVFGGAGDSIIVEFSSPVEAVRCAVGIQQQLSHFNDGIPENQSMKMRIGLNLGDIIVDDGNLFGDGVNIAARLEAIAPTGGICLSQTVYDQVRNKVDCSIQYLGEKQVKNIAEPIRTYQINQDKVVTEATTAETIAEALRRPAVAVLPFANLSGDPEQEYFSDGLSEDLITALTLWRSFPVIARNSSFAFKGNKSIDAKQIGSELGAQYLVEGSIRKSGNRIRVTAQLIDVSTGHHVWAQKYDRVLEDVFELQDEITEQIAATVEPTLEKAEIARSRSKKTESLDAWDYCLRGRSFMHDWDDTEKAREMFEHAIKLDPDYSDAYADLAWTYSRDMMVEKTDDRAAYAEKMYDAAQKAVSLDDRSSLASYRLSSAYIWRNEHDLAILEGRRAVELNPLYSVARHALGNKLDLVGDSEGIPMMVQAEQLNPRDPQRNMQLTFLARAYLNAEEYEKSIECTREALKVQPNYANAYYVMAIAYGHMGQSENAKQALLACDQIQPGFSVKRSNWKPYVDDARNEHLQEGLQKAGLT